MKNVVLFVISSVLFFGSIDGMIAWMSQITHPHNAEIGPNDLYFLLSDEKIISSKEDKPVSFKGSCNFVLENRDTNELFLAETIPAAVGESGPTYKITDFNLGSDEYLVKLCSVSVYAQETTTVTVENDLGSKIFFCLGVFFLWVISLLIPARIILEID